LDQGTTDLRHNSLEEPASPVVNVAAIDHAPSALTEEATSSSLEGEHSWQIPAVRQIGRVLVVAVILVAGYFAVPAVFDFLEIHPDGPFGPIGGEIVRAPAAATGPRIWPMPSWVLSLSSAKQAAFRDHKDILILASSGRPAAASGEDPAQFAYRLLTSPEFRSQAARSFVFGTIPAGWPAPRAGCFEALRQTGKIAFLLADENGVPYAAVPVMQAAPKDCAAELETRSVARMERDRLLMSAGDGRGPARLQSARKALAFLEKNMLTVYYRPLLEIWARAALEQDPHNEQGLQEIFFEAQWLTCLLPLALSPENLDELCDRLDEWKHHQPIRDVDRFAWFQLTAGMAWLGVGIESLARTRFQRAMACEPADRGLRLELAALLASTSRSVSGTAFVVASGGYVLTSAHALNGQPQIFVPGVSRGIVPEILVQDRERDIALCRLRLPETVNLRPLPIGDRSPASGERLQEFGWIAARPGSEDSRPFAKFISIGEQVDGLVPSPPREPVKMLVVADGNPDIIGGPVCDSSGSVVGMLTSHSRGAASLMLPGNTLASFIRPYVTHFQPAGDRPTVLEQDLGALIRPSVLLIIQTRKSRPLIQLSQ
jgi:hypothetical protein